ncbi:MAG: helix-turn-helix domain-containing protein [Desulfobacteraceae bacterium]|jgi:AraC-like DNA-binding protein
MANKDKEYIGSLYLFHGYSMFLGTLPVPKLHSHHVTEIVIGKRSSVNIVTEKGTYKNDIILIGPDRPHTAKGDPKEVVIIILDPESELSLKLVSKYLGDNDAASIPVKRDMQAINRYFSDPSIENALKIYHSFIDSLEFTDSKKTQKDIRITEAVNFIRNLDVKKASTNEIAEHVGLSEGRLIHLFKEQIGIPIRRYLIWHRIMHVMRVLLSGKSPTCAAHEAEFADYAHLSRNFTAMFGYSLSMFFKYIKFIKVKTSV